MALEDQVVVVTGAGRGLGREIALRVASAGAAVVLAARSVDLLEEVAAAIESMGRPSLVAPIDLRDPDSVSHLADVTLDRFAKVDVLINNAGVGGPSAPLWDVSLDDWQETLAVNVTGAFLCCRAFLPSMIERRSGSIVTIGSITGKRPLASRSAYATTKMALVGLTRTLATDAGPYGIRVNLVSPGAIEGERIEWVLAKQAEARDISVAEAREEFLSGSPLHRLVTPGEVARVVVFLASAEAGGITGADINVTTGMVMY